MNSRERILAALTGKPVDRPPVWMMRQAGRTLPEYRALKEKYSFWELCRTPELAMQVTMQPLQRFPVDAAIIFSDILVIPAAMGIQVDFTPAPRLATTIASRSDVEALNWQGAEQSLSYVAEALRLVRQEMGDRKALMGFSGAPYTLACYMIDGIGSKGFTKTRTMMYEAPELMEQLLDRLTDAVEDYVTMQINAGIDGFQLFDTWAIDLDRPLFDKFVLPRMKRLFARLQAKGVPGIYYINGIGSLLEGAQLTGAQALGIDWRLPLGEVRKRLGPDQVVQGNLDPLALFSPPQQIRQAVNDMLAQTGGRNHVANLGHGLTPTTPLAGIEAFVQAVLDWKVSS